MQTRDLDEAIAAVGKVYCPHRIAVVGAQQRLEVRLAVTRPTTRPLVELSYGVPVRVDAGDFPRLFLMMHCARGMARTHQDGRKAEWGTGRTLPFSAGFETQLWFDRDFMQRSVRLEVEALERLCARWLGHPLTAPLRLELQPFSLEFERTWQRTLDYIWSFETNAAPLTGAISASLDEHLLTLLLHRHPHNYSDELFATTPTPVPGLVRRAERYIEEHADEPITVSDVAAGLGVSVRSLQQGFRTWRNTTPLACLRQVRLRRVREQLLCKELQVTVSEAAHQHGFGHFGRFSAYYREAFGEAPNVTRRRAKSSGN
jgi:AraC-like DNA-binding protein